MVLGGLNLMKASVPKVPGGREEKHSQNRLEGVQRKKKKKKR